jgi:hypothetical protein
MNTPTERLLAKLMTMHRKMTDSEDALHFYTDVYASVFYAPGTVSLNRMVDSPEINLAPDEAAEVWEHNHAKRLSVPELSTLLRKLTCTVMLEDLEDN